jgi:serine protease Do
MRSVMGKILMMAALAAPLAAQQPPAPPPPAESTPAPPAPRGIDAETRKQLDETRKQVEKTKRDAARVRAEARRVAQEANRMRGAYLGVDIRDVTAERAAALKLKEERGVEVTMVDQDAPAGKAGLKAHDVILSFNGAKVDGVEQLRNLIHDTPAGRNIALGISRDGKPMTVNVQLGTRKQYAAAMVPGRPMRFAMPDVPMPPMPPMDFDIPQFSVLQFSARNGVVVEDLTPQLGEFFGVKNGEGVLVRAVEKGSPAEAAGLRAGDIIVKVGGDHVACTSDWKRLIRQQRGGNVPLGIVRDKREQSLSLKLPEQKTSDASTYKWEWPDVDIDLEELNRDINREVQRITPQMRRTINASVRAGMQEMERALKEAQRELERELRQAEHE